MNLLFGNQQRQKLVIRLIFMTMKIVPQMSKHLIPAFKNSKAMLAQGGLLYCIHKFFSNISEDHQFLTLLVALNVTNHACEVTKPPYRLH